MMQTDENYKKLLMAVLTTALTDIYYYVHRDSFLRRNVWTRVIEGKDSLEWVQKGNTTFDLVAYTMGMPPSKVRQLILEWVDSGCSSYNIIGDSHLREMV